MYHGSNWVLSVAFHPNDSDTLVSGSRDKTIKIWHLPSGECQATFKGHSNMVLSVAFKPGDSDTLVSGSADNTIKIWHLPSGECQATFKGHSSSVYSVAWSADGKLLASGSSDETVRVWSADDGSCAKVLSGHSYYVNSVAWSPDGKLLASGSDDKTVRVWSADDGSCAKVLSGHNGSRVNGISFSTDGKFIASCSGDFISTSDNSVRVFDVQSGAEVQKFAGHSKAVLSVAFHPNDSDTLVSGSRDTTVKTWHVPSGKCQATFEGHSKDNKACTCNHSLGYPGYNANPLCPVQGHSKPVLFVTFHPNDSDTLVSGSEDKTIKIWHLPSGECQATFEGHSGDVTAVAFNPKNDDQLASASHDRTIKLWSLADGQCKQTLRGHGKDNKACTCNDTLSYNANPLCPVQGHRDEVLSVAFSLCGTKLASGGGKSLGGGDCNIRIWSMETGACDQVLKPHTYSVSQVEFQDDSTLVSCSLVNSCDGSTKFWDISTGTPKTEVPGQNFIFCKAAAGTKQCAGHFLVTAKGNLVLVYHADAEANDGKKEAVAFFSAPSPVQAIACTGDQIGIGCQSGFVLHLQASWLVEA